MASGPPVDLLPAVRRLLLVVLALGLLGIGAELVLLGHVEDWRQWIPVALAAAGLVAVVPMAFGPGRVTVAAFRVLMTALIASGGLGIWLHYRGNAEFELEMTPGLSGWRLFAESLTGATPALAPGAMVQLGLIGLVATYRLLPASGRESHRT